jgi:hypothetical protein
VRRSEERVYHTSSQVMYVCMMSRDASFPSDPKFRPCLLVDLQPTRIYQTVTHPSSTNMHGRSITFPMSQHSISATAVLSLHLWKTSDPSPRLSPTLTPAFRYLCSWFAACVLLTVDTVLNCSFSLSLCANAVAGGDRN